MISWGFADLRLRKPGPVRGIFVTRLDRKVSCGLLAFVSTGDPSNGTPGVMPRSQHPGPAHCRSHNMLSACLDRPEALVSMVTKACFCRIAKLVRRPGPVNSETNLVFVVPPRGATMGRAQGPHVDILKLKLQAVQPSYFELLARSFSVVANRLRRNLVSRICTFIRLGSRSHLGFLGRNKQGFLLVRPTHTIVLMLHGCIEIEDNRFSLNADSNPPILDNRIPPTGITLRWKKLAWLEQWRVLEPIVVMPTLGCR